MSRVVCIVKLCLLVLALTDNLKPINSFFYHTRNNGFLKHGNNNAESTSSAKRSLWQRKIDSRHDKSLHYYREYSSSPFDGVVISKFSISPSMIVRRNWLRSLYMVEMDNSGDGTKHLSAEFKSLSKGKSYLEFGDFLMWEEIQALLADDLISLPELKSLWLKYVGSLTYSIDKPTFFKMNEDLDNMFEDDDNDDDEEDEDNQNNSDEEESVEFSDIWDASVDSSKVFPNEFVAYLSIFHSKHATAEGLLSYHSFKEWKDINELMAEGSVDVTCLKELWQEALLYKSKKTGGSVSGSSSIGSSISSGSSSSSSSSTSSGSSSTSSSNSINININNDFALKKNIENDKYMIDLDTFVRVNFRLEEVMEEIRKALNDLSSEDVRAYYTREFETLAGGEGLLSYQQLLDWTVVLEAMDTGLLSLQQLDMMWMALPKQPLGYYYRKRGNSNNNNNNNDNRIQQSDGITLDAFINFNDALEDFMAVAGET